MGLRHGRGGCGAFLAILPTNRIRHFINFYLLNMRNQVLLPRFMVGNKLLVLRQTLNICRLICQFRLHVSVKNYFLAAVNNLGLVYGHAPIVAATHV
jgi:hypothetical protein